MSTDPYAPYGRDSNGDPLPAPTPEEIAAKDAELEQLRKQLADASGERLATAAIGAVPEAATHSDEPVQPLSHALAPGSTGPEVEKLAQSLEAAGEKTYLSDASVQNYAHVFGDDLMEAVRRVLHDHPEIAAAEGAERQRLLRWINGLEVVNGEVRQLIDDVATTKAKSAA